MSDILSTISTMVIEGNFVDMVDKTNAALEESLGAEDILNNGLMPGMDHVGVEFKAGNMFVPEVLRSAKAMQAAMDILRPILAETGVETAGKIVLGTVKGDFHDIGKNLVGMMCEGAGFEIIDLGKDIAPEAFVNAIKEHKPKILGMSAMLTTTMRTMERIIKALEEAGVRDTLKIMIGGAPVTLDFANKIGADGYAANAASAADMAKQFAG
ncbi:MAG: corrinoid protein [Anaerolineales bacterium]|nr:corrinoid protein [Anaerolineales bacterium]